MIFNKASRQKEPVIKQSIYFSTLTSFPSGSSSGVSRARVRVETIMSTSMIYSKTLEDATDKHILRTRLFLPNTNSELPVMIYLTSTKLSWVFEMSNLNEWLQCNKVWLLLSVDISWAFCRSDFTGGPAQQSGLLTKKGSSLIDDSSSTSFGCFYCCLLSASSPSLVL